jgi:nitrogen fixation protein NifU and related proteins
MTTAADIRSLYEEVILDHNRSPRNFQKNPAGSTNHAHGFNPLCSDEFRVHLRVENGVIRDVGFEGAGCAVSTASASLMTEAVKGKTVEEAERLFRSVHNLLMQEGETPGLGKLAVLSGVRDYPMRVKCATLAWHTLHAALANSPQTVNTEDPEAGCGLPLSD